MAKRLHSGIPAGEPVPGKDGRVIQPKVVTLSCYRCGQSFTCLMVTRPLKYCAGCAGAKADESRLMSRDLIAAKRRARREAELATRPRPKIRYAGYDESERHEKIVESEQ
jgi:hypothetical protein